MCGYRGGWGCANDHEKIQAALFALGIVAGYLCIGKALERSGHGRRMMMERIRLLSQRSA